MIHYLYGRDLSRFPKIQNTMFKDRKQQFVDRLNWDLNVDKYGNELDEYDRPDSLYVICSNDEGQHCGSMRLRPSNSDTMVKEHFAHIIPGINFNTEKIWECTRFCSSDGYGPRVATSVLTATVKLMFEHKLSAFVAVFDERVKRFYRRIGIPPLILGSSGQGIESIGVGLWQFDERSYSQLVQSSLYNAQEYQEMYSRSTLNSKGVRLHNLEIA